MSKLKDEPFCHKLLISILLTGTITILLLTPIKAAPTIDQTGQVIVVNFNVPVDLGSSSLIKNAVSSAINQNATAIVIVMNTPGGLLDDMLSIISSIYQANQSGIPVYTYVPPSSLAASAGSYIAMASNKIVMGSGSEIGPSTPIVVGGSALERNHTQSAMLKLMVGLSERWGRNVTAAYNMVFFDKAYSAQEAYSFHLIDGLANSLNQAFDEFGLQGKSYEMLSEDVYDQLLSALSNPVLDGILILLGVLAILIDLYHPTVFLSVVGVIAIVAGLIGAEVVGASVLGFVIIAVAAGLILLELKLGHGFAVMGGAVVGAFGILFLFQGLRYSPTPITSLTELELVGLVAAGIVGGLYIRWILGPLRHRTPLTGPESVVGKTGIAVTDLNPTGEVRVEGIIWRAKTVSGEVHAGEPIRVKSIDNLVLIIEKI